MTIFKIQPRGNDMYSWASDLYPICRSITGRGVRKTLSYIKELIPDITIHEVPSGKKVFDWTVPEEWFIYDAWIEDDNGKKIVDFKNNNLHLVGYSIPINTTLSLEKLQNHLYSLPDQPNAIPYVTSYYKKDWGFCLSHNQRESLEKGNYKIHINSELKKGFLNYGEVYIKGRSKKEVFLSTYICHPSMANNELSGPVVTTALVQWLKASLDLNYSYRIVFIPETIGSITYLSKNYKKLKSNVIAGYNISCVGDDLAYSYLPSRDGNTMSDKAALHCLSHLAKDFKQYSWLDRGSDERQYCAPGIDMPIASIMRTKYGEYPEYHTSLDNMSFISPDGLNGALNIISHAIGCIENNLFPKALILGEPQLGKRGLYPDTSIKGSAKDTDIMMNILTYADGTRDLIDISNILGLPLWEVKKIVDLLQENKLISV
jgi:aminopeptidase-like protein